MRSTSGRSSIAPSVAATLAGDPSKAALFGYEMGAPMEDSFAAPHRRVGFFAGELAPSHFTGSGWRLFDAAVTWAIVPQALLVIDVGSDAAPADDAALAARLEGMGYHVRTKSASSVQAQGVEGMNLVVISEEHRVGHPQRRSQHRRDGQRDPDARHRLWLPCGRSNGRAHRASGARLPLSNAPFTYRLHGRRMGVVRGGRPLGDRDCCTRTAPRLPGATVGSARCVLGSAGAHRPIDVHHQR